MEPTNPPNISKRLWNILKIFCYMLRKSISKHKLILDLQLLLKRSKLVGKSLGKHRLVGKSHAAGPTEFQFTCTNTPLYAHYSKTSRRYRRSEEFGSLDAADIAAAFRMMSAAQDSDDAESMSAWSALPTPSPMVVRQLRITDSPFPVDGNEGVTDEDAEKFINWFREQLWRQQLGSQCSTPEQGYFGRHI